MTDTQVAVGRELDALEFCAEENERLSQRPQSQPEGSPVGAGAGLRPQIYLESNAGTTCADWARELYLSAKSPNTVRESDAE